jgi:hypothetical protein
MRIDAVDDLAARQHGILLALIVRAELSTPDVNARQIVDEPEALLARPCSGARREPHSRAGLAHRSRIEAVSAV